MKKYYLHNGAENIGPFDIEELKNRNITRTTEVWCEGMSDWQNANDVEELKALFASMPPPIKKEIVPPAFKQESLHKSENLITDEIEEETLIFGFRKNVFYALVGGIVIVIGLVLFNNMEDNNREKLLEQNRQTEAYNKTKKDLEEQKTRLAEQEKIEEERLANEKKQAIEKRSNQIIEQLNTDYQNLEEAKQKLNDVTAFKILRSSSERNEQINNAQETIDIIKNDIQQLEAEMKKLNPTYNL